MSPRERIIEGTWSCSSCDRKQIPARYKSCPDCNNPREGGRESQFDYGGRTATGASTRETVEDERALELARAGADWLCHFCGTANRGDKPKCRHCGAKRDGSERGAVLDDEPAPAAPAPPPRRPPPVWLYVAAGVLVVGGLAFWATRKHEEQGRVASRSWTRIVHREAFTRTTKEGWLDELRVSRAVMPVDGKGGSPGVEDVRDCVSRQRGTRQVPDGTERVCRTRKRKEQCGTEEKCAVEKLKNGFAKEVCHDVPKYCEVPYEECGMETRYRTEPVYGQLCRYTTWEWKAVAHPELRGGEDPPRWPEVRAGPLERLRREEKYTVTIEYQRKGDRHTHEVHPRSEVEFARWKVGAPVRLMVSNVGAVGEVSPGL